VVGFLFHRPNKVDYLKYYFLEDYLLGEVRYNFCERKGVLLPEEFFSIVIWKANRAKTKMKDKFLVDGEIVGGEKLKDKVEKLTKLIYEEKDNYKKLDILLSWGFRLPMATAILTILYPEEFTVYDVRVREQLSKHFGQPDISKDISYRKNVIDLYFKDFLPKVNQIAEEKGLSLRDADRYLFGKSFYEDLMKLIK
jgi:hypothetical protein